MEHQSKTPVFPRGAVPSLLLLVLLCGVLWCSMYSEFLGRI